MLLAAGIRIDQSKAENFGPTIGRASFNVEPSDVLNMNTVVFYSRQLQKRSAERVFGRIRDSVNKFRTQYRLSPEPYAMIETGDNERHWGVIERFLSGKMPSNVFILDFTKPKGSLDPAYPVVKQMLTQNGYLSQFVNFKTCAHDQPERDRQNRSPVVLQGVARQILQKAGVRLWWVGLPKELPLPAVFVGVDVFHAPRVFDPKLNQRVAKASCAAIIVQVVRQSTEATNKVELYSETFARGAGEEYGLEEALKLSVQNALATLRVNPMCCIIWRDGIGDSAFDTFAAEEIKGVRAGLEGNTTVGTVAKAKPPVPLSYVVCQKRIATKFVTKGVPGHEDGKFGAPSGTLVRGIQGLKYETFYIQGRAPPFSTPKPVRFIVVQNDKQLEKLSLPELTWDLCHDYPNWPGSIKVPSVCQMAHKLAELGGSFVDCGRNIDNKKFANTVHFL